MPVLVFLAFAAPAIAASTDLSALDEAIERCQRDAVLPVFAAEPTLRSAFLTSALSEQAAISAQRLELANKRRSLRESALGRSTSGARAPASESDQDLALVQLALEDRQRALDDRRRLEAMRHDAVDAKRQYFLTRCGQSKPKN